jgi:RNA polymerase sigma-70 factor (ECF subfamily)
MPEPDALVRRCQQGELAAFTELFRAFQAPLYRLALAVLREPADAEDALQETYLRVFRQIRDYRGQAALRTWLTAILVNVCRDHLRRARLRRMLPLDWLHGPAQPTAPDPAEAVHQQLQRQSLMDLIARLDDNHRLPVLLHYLEELPAAEVGRLLGLRTSVVYSRLNTARERLRAMSLAMPATGDADLHAELQARLPGEARPC